MTRHPEGNSEVGQPIIFGMARECLAKANIAAKEGRQYDELRYSLATPSYLLWDLIFLPAELAGVVLEKLGNLLPARNRHHED